MKNKLYSFARISALGASASCGLTLFNNLERDRNISYSSINSWFKPRGFCLQAKESGIINDLNMGHGTKWNSNWDFRSAESLVKPLKKEASDEEKAEYNKKIEESKPKATRVLILVRHGQYENGKSDSERFLTAIGREQANLTGQRLRAILHKHLEETKEIQMILRSTATVFLGFVRLNASLWAMREREQDENGNIVKPKVKITKSTMTRATETGDIIHSHLPELEIESCDLLREGAPCPPEPPTKKGDWDVGPEDFFVEGARIEAAFRKYFHRADPSQKDESVDILVCHGNVIRYFICRALQVDPSAWLRMSVLNGSISMVTIRPSGGISIRQVGEAGHFPPHLLTFN